MRLAPFFCVHAIPVLGYEKVSNKNFFIGCLATFNAYSFF